MTRAARRAGPSLVFLVVAVLVGLGDPYVLTLGVTAALAIMLATALNVSMGLAGSVNLGVGAFYGCGAYTAALLSTRYHRSIAESLVLAVLLSAVAAVILGPLLLRTRSLYFAIATLAFNAIFVDIVGSAASLGGELGIAGIPRPEFLGLVPSYGTGSLRAMYVLTIVALAAMLSWFAIVKFSRFGRILEAMREDELLCESMGHTALTYRVGAFVMTAVMGAITGVLYAYFIQYVNPGPFSFLTASFQAFVIVAVGGAGTVWGPVIAGGAIVAGPSLLGFSAATNQYIYGGALLLVVMTMPGGIQGGITRVGRAAVRRYERIRKPRPMAQRVTASK